MKRVRGTHPLPLRLAPLALAAGMRTLMGPAKVRTENIVHIVYIGDTCFAWI